MSRQSLIENYFNKTKTPHQIKSDVNIKMESGTPHKRKKRNLSLLKANTPSKSPKIKDENKSVSDVVVISSDDETENRRKIRTPGAELSQRSNESVTDCSVSTELYSPQKLSPLLLKSPRSSSKDQLSQTFTQKSPQSRNKFFSPGKKRSVPIKAKRNLDMSMRPERTGPSRILFSDDLYEVACEGMDDKTLFLLNIINKYLNNPSLRGLLSEESQKLLIESLKVVKPGLTLVCRLYWKKDGWKKKEKLIKICSDENKPIDDSAFQLMMNSLVDKGFVVEGTTENMVFDDFIAILKKEDLKQICKELKLKMDSKKDAVEALMKFRNSTSNISNYFTGNTTSNAAKVLKMMFQKAGACYKLSPLARDTLYRLYIIMYLGMDYNIIREKKLELMLIYDKIKRETYPIDKAMEVDDASVVFKTRDDFERYITAHNIYEDYLRKETATEKCDIVKLVFYLYKDIRHELMESYKSLPQWLQRYTPAHIYVRTLDSGIQELKKLKNEASYGTALDILDCLLTQHNFRQHRRADWVAEKAHILHACLERYDEAAEVLLQGFNSTMPEEEKDIMRPRAIKIARQKNITIREPLRKQLADVANKDSILEKSLGGKEIYKQPMERTSNRGKVKFETRTTEGRTVQDAEEFCIMQYICSGEFTHGEHWEGRMISTIFFLLFWDIIYSKPQRAQGVFLSHYQQFPLDLYTDGFYENRKEAINRRLELIESADEDALLEIMEDTWNNRPDSELWAASRAAIRLSDVRAVSRLIRGRALSAICRRLATRYRHAHSGFPDLTLWNEHTNKIKFVEVKTDSDKPSMKQLQWMSYLREIGVDTEFCYVGVNATRQRCRNVSNAVKSELDIKAELL